MQVNHSFGTRSYNAFTTPLTRIQQYPDSGSPSEVLITMRQPTLATSTTNLTLFPPDPLDPFLPSLSRLGKAHSWDDN